MLKHSAGTEQGAVDDAVEGDGEAKVSTDAAGRRGRQEQKTAADGGSERAVGRVRRLGFESPSLEQLYDEDSVDLRLPDHTLGKPRHAPRHFPLAPGPLRT